LTLDNTGVGNSVINAGSGTLTNSGTDVLATPLNVANTNLAAVVAGGTLQLTNTSTGTTANVIGSSSTFTVNSGGTLRESAVGTGSLVTGNLTHTGPLNNAPLNLAGGTFITDPTASTASNGLASKSLGNAGNNNTETTFDFGAAATSGAPTFQTAAFNAAPGLANTFSFGTASQTAAQ